MASPAAAAAQRKRNPRVSKPRDRENLSQPQPTRGADATLQVDATTQDELDAELRHLRGCPSEDPENPERRLECFEIDALKQHGDHRVPVTWLMLRCIDCGEAVKAEIG